MNNTKIIEYEVNMKRVFSCPAILPCCRVVLFPIVLLISRSADNYADVLQEMKAEHLRP